MPIHEEILKVTHMMVSGENHACPYVLYPGGSIGGEFIPYQLPFSDHLLETISRCEFISAPIPRGMVLRRDTSDTRSFEVWLGRKPDSNRDSYNQRITGVSVFERNLKALFTDWSFVANHKPKLSGERSVLHYNLVGQVTSGITDSVFHREANPDDLNYLSQRRTFLYGITPHTSGAGISYDQSVPYSDSHSALYFAHTAIPRILQRVDRGEYDWTEGYTTNVYSDFTYDVDGLVISRIQYDVVGRYDNPASPYLHERHYTVTIFPSFVYFRGGPPAVDNVEVVFGEWVKFRFSVHWKCHYDIYTERDEQSWVGYEAPTGDFHWQRDDYAHLVHDDNLSSTGGFKVFMATRYQSSTVCRDAFARLTHFQEAVERWLPDLYASVFFSTKDAFETNLGGLSSNNIENFLQLSQLRELVDPLRTCVSLFKHVRSGNIGGSFKDALNLATEAKLLYSYGIFPTYRDAQDFAKRAAKVKEALTSGIPTGATIRGRFTYDIPEGYLPFPASLVAHSKIVYRFNAASLLASLLPLNAIGLLPTLSNLWDLVPFSFVADWFTNVGDRLKNVDTSVMLFALDVPISVHSILIVAPLTSTELRPHGCYPGAGGAQTQPRFHCYYRSTMSGVPVLSPSVFDFNQPTGPHDWGTVGSLIYQLAKR